MGSPLSGDTMMGAQASEDQYNKILSYMDIAKQEGAEILVGGAPQKQEGALDGGYYIQPTVITVSYTHLDVYKRQVFDGVVVMRNEA